MWKKMSMALLLVVASTFTGLNAKILPEDHSSLLEKRPVSGKHEKHERQCRDHHTNRLPECCPPAFIPEVAYFFLRPSDIDDNGGSRLTASGAAVEWLSDVFTIKSRGVNVVTSTTDFGTDISFSHSGIYLLSYTMYANAYENAADAYTMELYLNGSAVPGSRFTSTLAYVTSGEEESLQVAQQLFGHVITYVPTGATLELRNVSRFTIRAENKEGLQGVVSSIAIQKLVDSI